MDKSSFNLLIVEDDESLLQSWERDIKEFNDNSSNEILINLYTARSPEEAVQALNQINVHFLILDLRLPKAQGDGGEAEQGNRLLKGIIDNYPVITAVVSGHPEEFSKEELGEEIKIFTKGEQGNQEVLKWFHDSKDLAEALSETLNELKKIFASLFNNSIWKRWKDKWSSDIALEDLKSIVVRQTAAYISETITHAMNLGSLHHPEEFYLSPPLRNRLHTGDIIEYQENIYVVVSPQCNMANDSYPSHIMLASCQKCTETDSDWNNFLSKYNKGESKREEALKKLRGLLNQNIDLSKHFIPPFDKDGPWIVSFKEVMTVPSNEAENLLQNRIVSIAPSFIPNLIQRYASYIGRIGQPDVCPELTTKELASFLELKEAAE